MNEFLKASAEDELLLARCLKDEPGALEQLTASHGESLYGFLRSALGKRAVLVHSILTASFVEVLRASNAFNLILPLRVLLMRELLSRLHKQLKEKHSEGPLKGIDRRLSVLLTCLGRLSWEARVILLLRDQMDYSLDEIQAVLSKPESEVRIQIQEARLHFRGELQKLLKQKKAEPS